MANNVSVDAGNLAVAIISNPVFDYIAGMLIVVYLNSHYTPSGQRYLGNAEATAMELALHAAFAAHAFSDIYKVVHE